MIAVSRPTSWSSDRIEPFLIRVRCAVVTRRTNSRAASSLARIFSQNDGKRGCARHRVAREVVNRHVALERFVVQAERQRGLGFERSRMRQRHLSVDQLEPAPTLTSCGLRRGGGAARDSTISRACMIERALR